MPLAGVPASGGDAIQRSRTSRETVTRTVLDKQLHNAANIHLLVVAEVEKPSGKLAVPSTCHATTLACHRRHYAMRAIVTGGSIRPVVYRVAPRSLSSTSDLPLHQSDA